MTHSGDPRRTDLDLVVRGGPQRWIVVVDGAIDISTMAQFSAVLDQVVGACTSGIVVLDVTALGFLSARGMSEMLRAHQLLQARDARLVLAGASPDQRRILGIVGLDGVLELRDRYVPEPVEDPR